MKILIMSDLHFEFMADFGKSFLKEEWPEHDICVIAGDLATADRLEEAIIKCCKAFKKVLYIAGNHEYYGSGSFKVKKLLKEIEIDNFHYLDNEIITIDGQRFIAGTMWFVRESDPMMRMHINDFHYIADPETFYKENDAFLLLLEKSNITNSDIVISHHLPSQKSVVPEYQGSEINCFFVCDVEPFIAEAQPRLWIHGHTHDSLDYYIGQTRVICNPFGYRGENRKFSAVIYDTDANPSDKN